MDIKDRKRIISLALRGKTLDHIANKFPMYSRQKLSAIRTYARKGKYDTARGRITSMIRDGKSTGEIHKKCPTYSENQIRGFKSWMTRKANRS